LAWLTHQIAIFSLNRGLPVVDFWTRAFLCEGNARGEIDSMAQVSDFYKQMSQVASTGRQPWIFMDDSGHSIGFWSGWKTPVVIIPISLHSTGRIKLQF
jgi:hypothetical protein